MLSFKAYLPAQPIKAVTAGYGEEVLLALSGRTWMRKRVIDAGAVTPHDHDQGGMTVMRGKRVIFLGLGAIALAFALVQAGPLMSQVEQPKYAVERSDGQFEVRRYPAMIVAQVEETGARKAAIGRGFSAIAGYIFGGNRSKQKVAMTAPVLQRRDGPDADASWSVQFVMPQEWTLATLPKPNDARVTLVTQPPATFAVTRFSGLAGDTTVAEKTQALNAFIARQKLEASGAPILAFFNPPWTLPFLRRNEIMLEVHG